MRSPLTTLIAPTPVGVWSVKSVARMRSFQSSAPFFWIATRTPSACR